MAGAGRNWNHLSASHSLGASWIKIMVKILALIDKPIVVVRAVGLEPTRGEPLQILSLICLPFHHARTGKGMIS